MRTHYSVLQMAPAVDRSTAIRWPTVNWLIPTDVGRRQFAVLSVRRRDRSLYSDCLVIEIVIVM